MIRVYIDTLYSYCGDMGTLRSFLCRRVFTPYLALFAGLFFVIYNSSNTVSELSHHSDPMMYEDPYFGWILIAMAVVMLIASNRNKKIDGTKEWILFGIELVLILSAFGASFLVYEYIWDHLVLML